MATRATYQINEMTFYCHWDGYPEGAARRFINMIKSSAEASTRGDMFDGFKDRRGGFEFAFIRGNDDAEPTKSHQAHADTEFRYYVKGDEITGEVFIRQDTRSYSAHDAKWLQGDWRDIASYLNAVRLSALANAERHITTDAERQEWLATYPEILKVNKGNFWRGGNVNVFEYITKPNVEKVIEYLEATANSYAPQNPNHSAYLKNAATYRAALSTEQTEQQAKEA